jgi:hypothetical protein
MTGHVAHHACPGCGTPVGRALLACRTCWFQLPKPIRDEVNAAYRQRGQDARRHLLAVVEASRYLRDHA